MYSNETIHLSKVLFDIVFVGTRCFIYIDDDEGGMNSCCVVGDQCWHL